MANLSVQKITQAGVGPTYGAAAAGGDSFPNDGHMLLHVKNGAAASITVTVKSPTVCDQGVSHDLVITIPATSDRMIGPFPSKRFNNKTGYVDITYSAVATVTVAALQM